MNLLCFPLGIKTKSVLLFCSIRFPDEISPFFERTAWLYLCTTHFFPILHYTYIIIFTLHSQRWATAHRYHKCYSACSKCSEKCMVLSKDPVSLVTFSKFACQHGAIHLERHHRPVHGERLLELNNLCILNFCFEYTDEEKIVVSIAGDRQAAKLSPATLWEWNQVLKKTGKRICGCRSL